MGTVNYGTSDIITMAVNTDNYDDCDYEYACDCQRFIYDEIEEIICDYKFYHFDVEIKNGYYDGFYVDIKYQDYLYFDDSYEKQEVLKEVTQLKKMLQRCIDSGLIVCYPSWCSRYCNKKDSISELKLAIRNFKALLNKKMTYRNFLKVV